jgi:2',3'-cyclic-nucleotide 2'-phosphodiesterase (5'-nucleotidase family)
LTRAERANHLVLLYTAETQNFLEVCGCRQSGLGGLARRAALVQQVRQETPNVLLLDSGNQADDPRRGEVIAQAMQVMGYQGVTVGALDFKLGKAFFESAQAAGLPLVVSAWRPPSLPGWVKEWLLIEVGGRKVGVVGLTSEGEGRGGEGEEQRLLSLLNRLRREADLVVGLSQLGIERDRRLARGAQQSPPLIDLLIGNASAEGLGQPEVIGGTWIVPPSTRGQHVGRVDVSFASPPRLRWRLIPLDKSLPDEPRVAALVGKYYAEQAEALLQASEEEEHNSVDVQAAYATAEQCAECHAKAYAMWQQQKHAHAVQTLVAKQRVVGECLKCHSEHYRRTGKLPKGLGLRVEGSGAATPRHPQPTQPTPDGVSCSTCHGEGVIHSLTETKQSITRNPGQALCKKCHDKENDDDFDYKRDVKKIRHW